ncbi:MAG: binding-protein dependent transport system inner rane protein, partial [Geminicoccaceae bacterium]|nr:binding-protein dependent transport system inner rane protein [Geminicoccaceae bacterium]
MTTATLARRDRQFGYLLAAPGLAALMLVILFPLLFTLLTSAFDYTLIEPTHDRFVGLGHYRVTVALMLNTVERGRNVYYLILLFPLLMNPVVVGLIWRMFLHPVLGIVNYLLSLIGIHA